MTSGKYTDIFKGKKNYLDGMIINSLMCYKFDKAQ